MSEDNNNLIIRLDQKVMDLSDRVERGFSEIKDTISIRIVSLEKTKADLTEVNRLQLDLNDIQETLNKKVVIEIADLKATRNDFRWKIKMVMWALGGIFALLLWHITGGIGGFHI